MMKKHNFLGLGVISIVCLMITGGSYATDDDPRTLFSFQVPKNQVTKEQVDTLLGTTGKTVATTDDVNTAVSGKLNKTELATEVGKLGYATSTELTALNNKLPARDASTGAMTWTDPNGNSASYGGYTFWVMNTYNKKISNSWFQCTTWTTDAPTSSWILEHEIQGLQCHSSGGWTYGTNCLLDGSIESYNVSPAKFKYNLCKALQSGDITALIDEQVTAKGYATPQDINTAVSGKADQADLTALAGTVQGKLSTGDLATEVGKLGYVTTSGVDTAVSNALTNNLDYQNLKNNAITSGTLADAVAAVLASAGECETMTEDNKDVIVCDTPLAASLRNAVVASGANKDDAAGDARSEDN